MEGATEALESSTRQELSTISPVKKLVCVWIVWQLFSAKKNMFIAKIASHWNFAKISALGWDVEDYRRAIMGTALDRSDKHRTRKKSRESRSLSRTYVRLSNLGSSKVLEVGAYNKWFWKKIIEDALFLVFWRSRFILYCCFFLMCACAFVWARHDFEKASLFLRVIVEKKFLYFVCIAFLAF